MRKTILLALTVLLVAAAPPAPAANRADWLRSAQNADGGFGLSPGAGSAHLPTGWAALGLAAAGRNPLDVRRGGVSSVAWIRRHASAIRDIGEIERTILVLRAAGLSPRNFAGRNLVREMLRHRRRDGSVAGFVSYTSFGLMAMRASDVGRRSAAFRSARGWLLRQQNPDGGFGLRGRGSASSVDDTGYALQALGAARLGRTRAARRATGWLLRRQNPDGGFGFGGNGRSNAQSTSYAVQGLVAAGVRLSGVRRGGRTPLGFLASLTESSGRVRYSRTSAQTPVWVTAQALAAMARRPFPLRPVRRR